MMNHEDWLAAVEAGYEVGFQTPPEEMPSRDTWELGDERHQAFVAGLDSGQAARVEADRMEAEHQEFFDNYIRPVAQAGAVELPFAQREAIRRARAEELGKANRAVPVMRSAADVPTEPAHATRSQSRDYQPFRPCAPSREMSR